MRLVAEREQIDFPLRKVRRRGRYTRAQTSGTVITNKSTLQSNAVLKLAARDVVDVRAYMETNDGCISAVQNSFYGRRIA